MLLCVVGLNGHVKNAQVMSESSSSQSHSFSHWIAGEPAAPDSGEFYDDLNPLDDSVYARAAAGNSADVARAVECAQDAFLRERKSLPQVRQRWLLDAADLLERRAEEFVDILIDEVGSPILKAEKEVHTAVSVLRASAGATRMVSGKTLPTDVAGRLSLSLRQPIGVVAGITPFNVPLIKVVKHSAMPIATGNSVVVLPSEESPVLALRVAQLYADAGVPAGLFNVVTGRGAEIGDALTTHPLIRLVGFSGSTQVGRHIGGLCGQLGKRCTLEMGGKNPLVVLADADIAKAVQAAVIGAFLYQGQICLASSRIYVERPALQEFMERFTCATEGLGVGDLRDRSTMIGPIINVRQRGRVGAHLEDAVAKRARVITGGDWLGNRCLPTILMDVTDEMLLYREETFGPITAVYPVDSAQDALVQANDSRYGLSASVFTSNLDAAMVFAQELRAGMVHVNGGTIQEEAHVPFGGVGDSGFGREGTEVAIEDLTEWKWITIQTPEI